MRTAIAGSALILAVSVQAACTRARDREPDAAAIAAACGACHAAPTPSSASKRVWRQVLPAMVRWADRMRPGFAAAHERDAMAHFLAGAPERLEVRDATGLPPHRIARRTEVPLAREANQPEVTCLRALPGPEALVAYCDTARRAIGIRALSEAADRELLRGVGLPVFLELADVDRDGRQDLLVADIGSAVPAPTTDGRVLWIRAGGDGWEPPRELATGLGRVVGAALADLDGDGRDDLTVAEFGVEATGGIHVYTVDQLDRPLATRRTVDARAGTVKLRLADLDGDARLDIVAAIAQQHEQVVVLRNEGAAFTARTIFAAPTPGWGLVDLEVADFDGDGDLDVLTAAGDTLDTTELRPYHGVYLHRQRAGGFATELLGALPGAYALEVGDLDDDGDLDVAACAFIHPKSLDGHGPIRLMSAAWFEQRGDRAAVTHAIDAGDIDFLSLALADADRDGDLDVVVGKRSWEASSPWSPRRETAALVVYENAAPARGGT